MKYILMLVMASVVHAAPKLEIQSVDGSMTLLSCRLLSALQNEMIGTKGTDDDRFYKAKDAFDDIAELEGATVKLKISTPAILRFSNLKKRVENLDITLAKYKIPDFVASDGGVLIISQTGEVSIVAKFSVALMCPYLGNVSDIPEASRLQKAAQEALTATLSVTAN